MKEAANEGLAAGGASQAMRWQNRVPIFKNAVILRQLGAALGIPFGLVALVVVLASGASRDTLYALGLIGAVLLLTWLLLMLVHQGKYHAEFVLNDKGALCRTQARQAKKNRVINALTVIPGMLSGKPAAVGAGLLAQSRREVFIWWSHVTKVKYKPACRTILLRGGFTEQIALFCTDKT